MLSLIGKVQDSLKSLLRYDSILGPGKTFMVFHPSWGYFAREFRLRQLAIEVEGKEPSPKQMAEIISKAQQYGIRAIFVQPQFSQQSANAIARQLHARLCVADDLAYDWPNNLLSIAKNIATQ
ncbi:MAG TPA: zinc ABC transporter substrate-binding protein, partial [Chitinivibrionales bacterium]